MAAVMATDGRPTARCATEKARNGDAVKTRFAPRRRDGGQVPAGLLVVGRAGLRGGAHPPGNIADCRRTHPLDTAGVGAPVRVLESRLVWVCPAEPV